MLNNRNRLNLTDANRTLESIMLRLFNTLFGWELVDLNLEKDNFPAADLGDRKERIAIQVTTDTRRTKVKSTRYRAIKHNLVRHYDRLIIFFLASKAPRPANGLVADEGPAIEL